MRIDSKHDDFRLERPSMARAGEFLEAVRRSRGLHAIFVEPPTTPLAVQKYIERKTSDSEIGHFVIAADNRLAGVINLNDIRPASPATATLGYYAFKPYAGRGIMRAALEAVVALAFTEYGLERLDANIQPGNDASIAMIQSAGFIYDSFHPQFLKLAGRFRDHERWSLTASDWHRRHRGIQVSA